MSESVRELVLLQVKAEVAAIVNGDGLPLFKRVGRGNPIGQTVAKENRPAAFVVEFRERPLPGQIEEVDSERLVFGLILLGRETDFEQMPTELNELDAAVYARLENKKALGFTSTMHKAGRDEPEANQSLPFGSTMPVYRVEYHMTRGNPYAAA